MVSTSSTNPVAEHSQAKIKYTARHPSTKYYLAILQQMKKADEDYSLSGQDYLRLAKDVISALKVKIDMLREVKPS